MRYLGILVVAIALQVLVASTAMATTYEIVFRLETAEDYGALQVSVDYSAASPGYFIDEGADVWCDPNTAITGLAAADDDDVDELNLAIVAIPELEGEIDLYTCNFWAASAPSASDFTITLVDWNAAGHSVTPDIEISSISAK